MSRTLQLTEQLIARPSVTPNDEGCLELLAERLAPLGFVCERLDSGPADFRVSNLWAKRTSASSSATATRGPRASSQASTCTQPGPRTARARSASGPGRPCQGRCSPVAHIRIAAVASVASNASGS